MSAILRPLGWLLGLGCCVAAIYAAAGAALDRPDVLRLGAAAATSPSSEADYSVDPEQASRPPLNPEIFGAIAVDEVSFENAADEAGSDPDALSPSGASGGDDDVAPNATNTPRPRAASTDTPERDATSTPTPKPEATATKTPKPEPTVTNTPAPKPTDTNTPQPTSTNTPRHTPTKTPTSTKTPTPTKTPKHEPTATNTPQVDPTATKTPRRCRTPEIGSPAIGGSKRRCPTPTPTPSSSGE